MRRLAVTSIASMIALLSPSVQAADARAMNVATADHSTIDPNKDHYTVSLNSFWISDHDTFFQAIFGRTNSAAVTVSANAVLFDADSSLSVQVAHDLRDVHGTVNQPIGLRITLVDGLPADANFKFKLQIAMYRGNRVGDTLDALEKSKSSLPQDIFASPWLGYARAASAVVDSLFSVSETKYPFSFEGDVKAGVTSADGSMPSHYVILVAPAGTNDPAFGQLDQDKLTYDERLGRVSYEGRPLTAWSHAVLKIAKSPPPNISALVFGSSAPWAQLAQTQVLATPPSDFKTPAEIKSSAQALYKSLQDVITFLKKEPRFSKLDRALAMKSFSDIAVKHLRVRCQQVKGTDDACGLRQLTDISDTVDEIFDLAPTGAKGGRPTDLALKKEIDSKSLALQSDLLNHRPSKR